MEFVKGSNRVQLDDPLADGRQSERAFKIRRGVQRYLRVLGCTSLPELTLASGRRADLVVLGKRSEIWIIEIKSSIEDFKADSKWHEYHDYCDRLFFATSPDVPQDIFPEETGFILADDYMAEIIREAPEHKLCAATRKAVVLRFAQAAANRLHDLTDPNQRNLRRG